MVEAISVEHAFCVSDLHIIHSDDPQCRRFLSFLRERVAAVPRATVVILGDLLHFWFGRRGRIPVEFGPLIEALEELPRVVWVEGNHDMRLARALGPSSRIEVVTGALSLSHAGSTIHLEHGHQVDREDRGQLLLDRLLRTPLADAGALVLGSRGTQRLGLWAARASSLADGYDGRDPRWLRAARALAEKRRGQGNSLTVLGHGHYLGWWDEDLVCLGDWLHFNSYLELESDGRRCLRRYEAGSAQDLSLAESPLGEIPR